MKPGATTSPPASTSRAPRPDTSPTSAMRPAETARSPLCPGAPVPSTMKPPRITRSWAIRFPPLPQSAPPPLLLLRVLEWRHGLDGLFRRSGQDVLAILLLQLIDGDRHIVAADAHEAAGPDDHEGDGLVGGHDDVLDLAHPGILLVVHRLAQ